MITKKLKDAMAEFGSSAEKASLSISAISKFVKRMKRSEIKWKIQSNREKFRKRKS